MLGKGWDGVGNSAAKVDCLKGLLSFTLLLNVRLKIVAIGMNSVL